MEVASWVIDVTGMMDTSPPTAVSTYPADGAADAYPDAVVKIDFSEPVTGVDATSFTLTSAARPSRPSWTRSATAPGGFRAPDLPLGQRDLHRPGGRSGVRLRRQLHHDGRRLELLHRPRHAGGTGDRAGPSASAAGGWRPGALVMAIDPADGATNVARNTTVVATFSDR